MSGGGNVRNAWRRQAVRNGTPKRRRYKNFMRSRNADLDALAMEEGKGREVAKPAPKQS